MLHGLNDLYDILEKSVVKSKKHFAACCFNLGIAIWTFFLDIYSLSFLV